MYAAIGDGNTGAAIMGAVIVAVLLLMGGVEREESKAHVNRRRYWANGGPERDRDDRDVW